MGDAEVLEALERWFGHRSFRLGQQEAIRDLLNGKPVVLVMPTGSGKSLCFQLPALLLPGITIVISPLIALMNDQVEGLVRKGIAATYLNSSLSPGQMQARLEQIALGKTKLVYVAPERLRNPAFIDALSRVETSLVTVDEAHCISQWGHDFRPDYLSIRRFLSLMPNARTIAVTATATPGVRDDIIAQLGLVQPAVHVTGFERPNLYLQASKCPTHQAKLLRVLELVRAYGKGIVYCSTRKMTERVADLLAGRRLSPIIYHGAMGDQERARAADRFLQERAPVVVATNAFGMGIDRADIRFVAHWDIPGSVEAYYQEIGRAGRDGAQGWCELLYNYADVRTQQFFVDAANPKPSDIINLWQTIRQDCSSGPVVDTHEGWATRAGIKNSMTAGSALYTLVRAGLIRRESVPGSRSQSVQLDPDGDARVLPDLMRPLEAKRRADQDKLDTMVRYAGYRRCRHQFILSYFGDATRTCAGCDNCRRRKARPAAPVDSDRHTLLAKILSCAGRMSGKGTVDDLIETLRGETANEDFRQLSTFALLKACEPNELDEQIAVLRWNGLLRVAPDGRVALTFAGHDFAIRKLDIPLPAGIS